MQQVVYVDILIVMNTVVTFLLLLTAQRFAGAQTTKVRLLIGSLIGGVYSLVMLAPKMPAVLMLLSKALMCITIVLAVFRADTMRKKFRCCIVFLCVNYLYAGVIYSVRFFTEEHGLHVNNGFAYFEFSYISLILLCTVLYFILFFLQKKLFSFSQTDAIFKVDLKCNGRQVKLRGLLDTGNQLRDLYTGKPVIVVNPEVALEITGFGSTAEIISRMEKNSLPIRFRLLPVKAVNAVGLLPSFTGDEAIISNETFRKVIRAPCIAITDDSLGDDRYQALINEASLR